MSINEFIDNLIEREGGYVNNPNDSGGPTKYGITSEVAKANGFEGDMSELPKELAIAIYKKQFWIEPRLNKIALVDESIADMLLNFGVLGGPQTAAKMLQRVINVLNHNGKDYPDLKIDGNLGPITTHALHIFVGKRGSEGKKVIRGMLASLMSVHLIECAERNPKNEEFEYGWQLNRIMGAFL